MEIHEHRPHDPVGGTETPQEVVVQRRQWLKWAGALGVGATGLGGYAAWQRYRGSDEEVVSHGVVKAEQSYEQRLLDTFPAQRDERWTYGRNVTERAEAARFTNFYEFSSLKSVWRYVDDFQPYPWTVTVGGLCRNSLTLDLADLLQQFRGDLVERQYRHRCVERWAMAIPWTGFPLAALIRAADPLAGATHVRFTSFNRPREAPHMAASASYPWPYVEGLTIREAQHDLTFLATGMYGEPLLKQHGAPIRLVVPWKYGYKSIKSIERIDFIDHEPTSFWTTLNPEAYPFVSNVDPTENYPWPQDSERMLGSDEIFKTEPFNGYGKYVRELYSA